MCDVALPGFFFLAKCRKYKLSDQSNIKLICKLLKMLIITFKLTISCSKWL